MVVWPSRWCIKLYKRILDLNLNRLLILPVWCNVFCFLFLFFDTIHRPNLFSTLCQCIDESDSNRYHQIYYITLDDQSGYHDKLREKNTSADSFVRSEVQWVHMAERVTAPLIRAWLVRIIFSRSCWVVNNYIINQ